MRTANNACSHRFFHIITINFIIIDYNVDTLVGAIANGEKRLERNNGYYIGRYNNLHCHDEQDRFSELQYIIREMNRFFFFISL